ncbi:hypothetical protein TNCT_541221, partial [Trichonephila clavata]
NCIPEGSKKHRSLRKTSSPAFYTEMRVLCILILSVVVCLCVIQNNRNAGIFKRSPVLADSEGAGIRVERSPQNDDDTSTSQPTNDVDTSTSQPTNDDDTTNTTSDYDDDSDEGDDDDDDDDTIVIVVDWGWWDWGWRFFR